MFSPSARRLEMALTIFGITDLPDGISKTKYREKTVFKFPSAKKPSTLSRDKFQNSRRNHVLIHACGIPKGTCLFFNLGWARNQQSEFSSLKWIRLANNLVWIGVWIVHSCKWTRRFLFVILSWRASLPPPAMSFCGRLLGPLFGFGLGAICTNIFFDFSRKYEDKECESHAFFKSKKNHDYFFQILTLKRTTPVGSPHGPWDC